MQFLTRLWGGAGGGSDLPYTPGDVVASFEGKTLWTLRDATTTTAGGKKQPASVFEYGGGGGKGSAAKDSLARNALRRTKTLRHPALLAYAASVESADSPACALVTEPVVPLSAALAELRAFPGAIAWGLFQVASALQFLCGGRLVHGSVAVDSVFVARSGDWKLWGLELVSDADALSAASPVCSGGAAGFERPPEFARPRWWEAAFDPQRPWTVDAFLFGRFVASVFAGAGNLPLPPELRELQARLCAADPALRPSPKQVLECAYFSNPYVDALLFLDTITLKDAAEKDVFFGHRLAAIVDQLPGPVALNKVLPHLVTTVEFGYSAPETLFKIMPPLLRIGRALPAADFNQKVTPHLVKWFAMTDRALRASLLENIDNYLEKLPQTVLTNQIWPSLATGFVDASPALRDLTVRSMLAVVPKLPEKIVNNDLLRFFSRLQLDPEPSIRTNTTVCIGKIAKHLTVSTRPKVLVPAFTRALKDAFPPARISGLVALLLTKEYFGGDVAAKSVIPAVAPLLFDPERGVRDEAMRCLKAMVEKAEAAVSEFNATQQALPHSQQAAQQQQAGWSILSSLAKKVAGDTTPQQSADSKPAASSAHSPASSPSTAAAPEPASAAPKAARTPMHLGATKAPQQPAVAATTTSTTTKPATQPATTSVAAAATGWDDFEDDGWGADSPVFSIPPPPSQQKAPTAAAAAATTTTASSPWAWDEDEAATSTSQQTSASSSWESELLGPAQGKPRVSLI